MADRTIPYFLTVEDRDRRYAEYEAAGGRLAEGMTCYVDGHLCLFTAGGWARLTPSP